MTYVNWKDAACRNVDPEWFFPKRGERTIAKAAKNICSDCPITLSCREWALEHLEVPYGIWGGLNEKQLRKEKSARKAA